MKPTALRNERAGEHEHAGETAGWIVRTGDRDVAAGASPMEAADRARRIGHDDGHLRPATADGLDSLDLPPLASRPGRRPGGGLCRPRRPRKPLRGYPVRAGDSAVSELMPGGIESGARSKSRQLDTARHPDRPRRYRSLVAGQSPQLARRRRAGGIEPRPGDAAGSLAGSPVVRSDAGRRCARSGRGEGLREDEDKA